MVFISFLAFLLSVPIQLAAFLGARWAVGVLAGVPRAWAPFRRFDVPESGVPRWARLGVAAAGPAATYLTAAFCFVVAMKMSPKPVYDATVDVRKGDPAEMAGIRNGDRVISIQGRPVSTFADLSAHVRELGRTGSLEIVVDRAGTKTTMRVAPIVGVDGKPKIGVMARPRYVSAGLGEAIVGGIALPGQLINSIVRVLRGALDDGEQLAGPAAIAAAGVIAPVSTALMVLGAWLTEIGTLLGGLSIVFALFGWRPRAAVNAGEPM